MKKILVLAAVLGFGFATLGYADVTPTAATPASATTPVAKKAAKKHHKHHKHTKKAVAPAPTAVPTAAAAN